MDPILIEGDVFPGLNQLSKVMESVDLDGSRGSNRESQKACQINAQNDLTAIYCWLNEYRAKETTYRTYQREAERLLLWSIYKKQKPLSSLNRDDLEDYIVFLDDPQPSTVWCAKMGGRGNKRGSSKWRPFTGPLSKSAKITTLSIIDSLLNYLVDARYLIFNPLSLRRKNQFKINQEEAQFQVQERILSVDEWKTMLDVLNNWKEETKEEKQEKERLKWIVYLLYFLGLRINELATHNFNAFRKIDDKWWFYVLGKGGKGAKIPVNDELTRAFLLYRQFLNLPPHPDADDETPLVYNFSTRKAISARQINKILKRLAIATSKRYKHEPNIAKKMTKFSAHWLRHLSASMQDRAGISFKHIRANLRHENDETTRIYVHAIDLERHDDMQKLRLNIESEYDDKLSMGTP